MLKMKRLTSNTKRASSTDICNLRALGFKLPITNHKLQIAGPHV
jgi:hypothetical protein